MFSTNKQTTKEQNMSEEPVYNPLAPIDIELKGRDFTPALVPEGQQPLRISAAELVPSKNVENQVNLHITSTLVNPVPSTKEGVVHQPGEVEFHTYNGVYATDKQKGKSIDPLARIADILAAVFQCPLDECPNLNNDTCNMMTGKTFLGIIEHEDDNQFGKQARLVRYLPHEG